MKRKEYRKCEFDAIIRLKCGKYAYINEFTKTQVENDSIRIKFPYRQVLRERLKKKYGLRLYDIMKMTAYILTERAYRAKDRREDEFSIYHEETFRYRNYFSKESQDIRLKVSELFNNKSEIHFEKIKDVKCNTCILTCPHAKYNKDNLERLKKKNRAEYENLINERNLRNTATQYLRASNLPLIPELIDFKMAHLQLKREIKKQLENEIKK